MAQADRKSGKNAYIDFDPTGAGAAIVLDTDYRTLNIEQSSQEIDGSAGDDNYMYMLPGMIDGSVTLTVLATPLADGIDIGDTGALNYGRAGNTAGLPKSSYPVTVTGKTEATGYQDVATLDFTFRITTDPTLGVWP